jgi:glycosyltransferase involved in cell wall biosynthesis
LSNVKDNKVITVCFLSHSSGIAGAEKAFPKLLEGLQERGIKVHLFLPSSGPITEVLAKKNISFDIIPYSRWLNTDINVFKRLKRTFKNIIMIFPITLKLIKYRCDIVYSNTSTICSGAFAAKLLGLPHIWHFREFGFEDYNYQFDLGNRLSFWFINKLSTLCLANSKAVAEKYKKYMHTNKIKVVYESYFQSIFNKTSPTKIKKEEFKCVIIGTLLKTKGHDQAIRAIAKLHSIGIKVKLYIIGYGDENYKRYLIGLTQSLGIENYVELMGYLDNPQNILKQFDVLLMCSQNEAFGLVTLEAMQAGVPVIGTRSGGTMELIDEGVTGLFYQPGDYVELSEKIKFLYENPDITVQMGKNGQKIAKEKFDPERYIDETLNVIREVLN